ncbi:MAG TPA: hypothetical protein VJB14_12005 [Planctomycetota bacterium]|nr:hypothetical protein [Planctomycetota bacterium]
MRRACTLLAALALAGCPAPAESPEESPLDAVHAMRAHADRGEWNAYWDRFSERGKGWFIGRVATAFAWDAYAQPIDPSQGEPSRRFLEKYDLTKEKLWRREEETADQACRRAARHMGRRGPRFCRELFAKRDFGPFPEDAAACVLEQTGDQAIVELAEEFRVAWRRIDGRWRCDGEPGDP